MWFKITWDEYVRKKYKVALNNWNKETGGGDGTPVSFQNYCDGNTWLTLVYLTDETCGGLLSTCTSGQTPSHLCGESGVDSEDTDGGGQTHC